MDEDNLAGNNIEGGDGDTYKNLVGNTAFAGKSSTTNNATS